MSEFRDFEEELARLRDRMNQILSNASSDVDRPEPMGEIQWMPPLDILENRDDIIIKADIPGMDPHEISLSVSGDVLHIKGERKQEIERDDENYHTIERDYGKFDRRVNLPTPVKVDSIKASYKNGVLDIRLPKLQEKKTGQIKVNLE